MNAKIPDNFKIGDVVDFRYQLKKLLGGGRVGKVFLAFDLKTGSDVAIKILAGHPYSEREKASFDREFAAVKNLNHPGVVKVYEQGEGYFIMEYVEGEPLSKKKEADVAQIFEIGIDIVRVLDYIHRQGVIHRDLKPENIKITSVGEVKILDFGFAIGSDVEQLSSSDRLAGTLNYMAPEVLKEFEVDPRVDLYSLGIIFYELVTGRLPFKSFDIQTTVVRQMEMAPPPPTEFNPKITPGFESIILKLIAKSPARRFQSAEELLGAMLRLAGRSEIIKIKVDRGRKFLHSSRFVGREQQITRVAAIFKKAMRGRGSFVLIRGEEGMGKSRMLKEFQSHFQSQGVTFLDVSCDPSLGAPLAAFSQAVYDFFKVLERANEKLLPDLAHRWGPILLPIVPALTHKSYMFGVSPGENMSSGAWRQQLSQFFIEIARQYPLGIFIDNLHWLDQESAYLLLELVQETQHHPIFLCGACRDSQQTEGGILASILPRLKLKKMCEDIELKAFSREELAPFLGSMIGKESMNEGILGRLYEVSRGIPLLAEETMKSMADDGLIYRRGGVWHVEVADLRQIRRPELLEDTLIEKYENLDKKRMLFLQIASIIGHPAPCFLLEKICRLDPQEVSIFLPDLIEQGFLSQVSKGTGAYLSIGSPRLTELIYEKMSQKLRQKLHEEIAKTMESLPEAEDYIEDLARHYFQASHAVKAMHYSILAGESAEMNCAYSTAVRHYRHALELAREKKAMPQQILDLLKKLGHAQSCAGQHDLALEHYQEGLEIARGQGGLEEEFHKGLGKVYLHKGKYTEALQHFDILLRMMRPKQKPISEELALTSTVHLAMGSYEEAENLLLEALSLAKRDKKKELQASIYRSFAEIHFMRGHWRNSLNHYQHALDILQSSGDQYLKAQINRGLARIYTQKGQTEKAYKYLEDALYFCHLTGDRELQVLIEIEMGTLLEYEGDLARAVELYQESLETAEDLEMGQGIARACIHLGYTMLMYERPNEAMEYAYRSMKIFEDLHMMGAAGECYLLLGDTFQEQGEYEKAAQAFKSGEKALLSVRSRWKLPAIYEGLAQVYQKLDKTERANKYLNQALKFSKKYEDEISLGKLHTTYAIFCAEHEKDLRTESMEHFVAALVFLEKVTCKLELAKTYYEYGKILLEFERQGDQGFIKVAMHQLEKCREIYRRADLQPKLNKTIRLIKECERERTDALYKKDLVVKLREFARELGDFEREIMHNLAELKGNLLAELGVEMEQGEVIAQIEKKIADTQAGINKRLQALEAQNASLLARVEELKAERESLLTLQKISNTINSVLDSQKLLNLIMDMVIEELRAERGFIVLKEDRDKFTFKAARNMDKEEVSNEDSNLSGSVVKKVIKTGEPVLTSDAQADGRFQSQSIMDLKLRSILCVPFTIKDRVIGAVYVDNRFVSGLFTERDLDFLVAFSNQAAIALENAFLYEELTEKERMEQELAIAARIQGGLLPKILPKVPGLEVYGKMIPAREVGGDYYDFIESSDKKSFSIVIGDVSGKGIPAGIVMVMARLILRYFLLDNKASTKETLLAANRLLKDNTEPFIFMSMLLARWDIEHERFVYTGAGHENLIVYHAKDKRIEPIPAGGVVLGVKDNIEEFLEEKELVLESGDCVIFYTDGVTESFSRAGEMLELDGFLDMVRKHLGYPPKEMAKRLLAELREYTGDAEQQDDITLTIVKKI